MSTFVHESGSSPQRTGFFLGILAIHALAIYALLTTVVPRPPPAPPPVIGTLIDKPIELPQAPTLPHVGGGRLHPGPVDVSPLLPVVDLALAPGGITLPAGALGTDSGAALVAMTPISYVATRSTDEFYPPQSIRLGEAGAAVVQVCVGTDGRVDGVPAVARSSGYTRLDAAAVRWAREAPRYTPARRDGTPVRGCKDFRVVFRLK